MKKHRWHAWDSNLGRQDGRCRRFHWAMAAPHVWTDCYIDNAQSLEIQRWKFAKVVAKFFPVWLLPWTGVWSGVWCPINFPRKERLTVSCDDLCNKQWIYLLLLNSVTRLGNLLDFGHLFKAFATINLPKSSTFLGNFCKGVKIYHFSSEIIFGQLL